MSWSQSRTINQAMDRLRRNQRVIVNNNMTVSLDEYITAVNKVELRSKQKAHLAAHRHAAAAHAKMQQEATVVADV